jgi:hypothetical protein
MAIEIKSYYHNCLRFMSGLNTPAKTYKVVLLSPSATFDPSHTTLAEVTNSGAYEVHGGGWASGGVALAGVAITADGTDDRDAMLDADDVLQLISGAALGPFGAYVIACTSDAGYPPLAYVELDSSGTIPADTYFTIEWPDTGLQRFSWVS